MINVRLLVNRQDFAFFFFSSAKVQMRTSSIMETRHGSGFHWSERLQNSLEVRSYGANPVVQGWINCESP